MKPAAWDVAELCPLREGLQPSRTISARVPACNTWTQKPDITASSPGLACFPSRLQKRPFCPVSRNQYWLLRCSWLPWLGGTASFRNFPLRVAVSCRKYTPRRQGERSLFSALSSRTEQGPEQRNSTMNHRSEWMNEWKTEQAFQIRYRPWDFWVFFWQIIPEFFFF